VKALDLSEALASLVGCSPFLGGDPYRAGRLLENLESLVRPVPKYELSFSRGGRSWALLKHATVA
jgi:hypothetical protein